MLVIRKRSPPPAPLSHRFNTHLTPPSLPLSLSLPLHLARDRSVGQAASLGRVSDRRHGHGGLGGVCVCGGERLSGDGHHARRRVLSCHLGCPGIDRCVALGLEPLSALRQEGPKEDRAAHVQEHGQTHRHEALLSAGKSVRACVCVCVCACVRACVRACASHRSMF